mmetsp:Transcript_19162/g.28211  ORF Transcript_19162/g.28211 Transcript_19162/m.28211 type:complete len:203 (-) Transcript_19162:698-1306(-)
MKFMFTWQGSDPISVFNVHDTNCTHDSVFIKFLIGKVEISIDIGIAIAFTADISFHVTTGSAEQLIRNVNIFSMFRDWGRVLIGILLNNCTFWGQWFSNGMFRGRVLIGVLNIFWGQRCSFFTRCGFRVNFFLITHVLLCLEYISDRATTTVTIIRPISATILSLNCHPLKTPSRIRLPSNNLFNKITMGIGNILAPEKATA